MEPTFIIIIVVVVFVVILIGTICLYCFCCRTDPSEGRRRRLRERTDRAEEAELRSGSNLGDDDNGIANGPVDRSGLSWDGNVADPNVVPKSRLEYDYDRGNTYNKNNYNNNDRYYKRSNGRKRATDDGASESGSGYSGMDPNNAYNSEKRQSDDSDDRRRRRKRRREREEQQRAKKKQASDAGSETGSYSPPMAGSRSIVIFRRPSTETVQAKPLVKSGMSERYKQDSSLAKTKVDFDTPPPPARKKYVGSGMTDGPPISSARRYDDRREERRRRQQGSNLKVDSSGNPLKPVKEYKVKTMIKEYKSKR